MIPVRRAPPSAPMRLLASVASVVAALACPATAAAANPEAQALFDEGKRLIAKGDVAAACEKFEGSQRLEPAGGTLLHLAACREQQGRTATAWTLFNEALSAARTARRKDREQAASEHIAALEPRLVRLRVVVGPAARAPGLATTRDGKPVDAALWGVAVPVDPGAHEVVASAPGKISWTKRVDIRGEGTTTDVDVPALEDGGPSPGGSRGTDPSPSVADGASSDGSTQRTLAVVTGGVGVVGVVVGTIFGLRSASDKDEADRLCGGPPPQDCPLAGVRAGDDAQAAGNVATAAFVIGGLALAGGAILWFTAPSARGAATSMMRGRLALTF